MGGPRYQAEFAVSRRGLFTTVAALLLMAFGGMFLYRASNQLGAGGARLPTACEELAQLNTKYQHNRHLRNRVVALEAALKVLRDRELQDAKQCVSARIGAKKALSSQHKEFRRAEESAKTFDCEVAWPLQVVQPYTTKYLMEWLL